jgi:hypothetical protein
MMLEEYVYTPMPSARQGSIVAWFCETQLLRKLTGVRVESALAEAILTGTASPRIERRSTRWCTSQPLPVMKRDELYALLDLDRLSPPNK